MLEHLKASAQIGQSFADNSLCVGRQGAKSQRLSEAAQSNTWSTAEQTTHSPEGSSHSDSDPDFEDKLQGDPDFAPAAKEGPSSAPKDSKAKLREKNKRAQKRFRARQKVCITFKLHSDY